MKTRPISSDSQRMKPIGALLAFALVVSACSSSPRVEAADLPTVPTTTTTVPVTTTIATTPTTTLPDAGVDIIGWLHKYAAGLTLEQTVAEWPGVESARYVGNPQTMAEFQAFFADRPELVASVDPATLPTSLRVKVTHASLVGEVAAKLRALSDVASVDTADSAFCDRFPGFAIVVFASDDLALTRLRNQLLAVPGIDGLEIIGREAAYAELAADFAQFPEVLQGVSITDMHVSLRAVASDTGGIPALQWALLNDPAVAGVHVPGTNAPPC